MIFGGLVSGKIGWAPLASALVLIACSWMASAQDTPPPTSAPGQTNSPTQSAPNAPEPKKDDEKKEENTNPAAAAAERTKEISIQAAGFTKRAGEQALFKARDWETGWFTGAYIEKGRARVAMTKEQRLDIYLTQTLTTPSAYVKRMFGAGIDQARGVPQWQGGWGGYGERFASREGQFISANSMAALGNAALGYEPRYDQCQCSGFWPRTRHAIMRNFMTYNRGEREIHPQWALFGGAFGGGLIATAWKPQPRNMWVNGGYAVLGQAGYGALLNFFIEFAGDINRKIGAKRKDTR
jgi:hypothetical protein